MSEITCPFCGALNNSDEKQCVSCSSDLQALSVDSLEEVNEIPDQNATIIQGLHFDDVVEAAPAEAEPLVPEVIEEVNFQSAEGFMESPVQSPGFQGSQDDWQEVSQGSGGEKVSEEYQSSASDIPEVEAFEKPSASNSPFDRAREILSGGGTGKGGGVGANFFKGRETGGKERNIALLAEILPAFIGFLGFGWLYVDNLVVGLILMISYAAWNLLMLMLIPTTLWLVCLYVPINLAAIGVSAFMLQKKMGS